MAKKVQIVIDVESDSVKFATDQTLTLTQQVRLLKQELQKVPEGTAEWTLLQQKYNETKDSLDRVNVKSKELFGTMSSLPGPIGQVSGQLDNTIGTLKTFSSLKLSDIKTQFVELGKDLGSVASNIGRLTGITAAYTVTARALSGAFQAVGISATTATVAARAFSAALIGTGIGIVVVAIGYLVEKLISLAQGWNNNTQELSALNNQIVIFNAGIEKGAGLRKSIFENDQARLKAEGASDYELFANKRKYLNDEILAIENNIKFKGIAYRAELELLKGNQGSIKTATEKYNKEIADLEAKKLDIGTQNEVNTYAYVQKLREEAEERDKKAAVKKAERIEKEKQQRESDLKEIGKNAKDATNALLTQREQERQKIYDDYQAKINLAKQYGKSTYVYEEARRKELADLTAKYNAEDIDAFEKKLADDLKRIEDANKAKQEAEEGGLKLRYTQGILNEDEYQIKLYESKTKYATSDKERQDAEIELLEYANGKKKESADITEEVNKKVAQSYLDLADNLAGTFTTIAGLFTKGSDLAKAFAIIGVLLNAASAIGKVRLATLEATADFAKAQASGVSYGLMGAAMIPINPVQGAALIASGTAATTAATAGLAAAKIAGVVQTATIGVTSAAQIAAILSVGKDSKTVSSGGGSGGGQAATPTFNGTVNVPAPVIGASQATQSGNLGQTIVGAVEAGNSRNRPIQAYVIGGQVTTQQQLDRRIALAAKMGG